MKILGIETATYFGGIAFIDEGRLITEYRLSLKNRHTERLLPIIDALLKETEISLSDLSAIAVSIGPGSFTGLRVGLATAQGLAIGSGLPLLPVPTLEAMAFPFRYSKAPVAPMITSRKDECYWTLFIPEDDTFKRSFPDSVGSIEEVLDKIGKEKEVFFVGDGIQYRDQIVKQFKGEAFFPPISLQLPLPSSVAELGLLRLRKGGTGVGEKMATEEVTPIYLLPFAPKKGDP